MVDEDISQLERLEGVEDIRIGARTAAERKKSRIPSIVAAKIIHRPSPCQVSERKTIEHRGQSDGNSGPHYECDDSPDRSVHIVSTDPATKSEGNGENLYYGEGDTGLGAREDHTQDQKQRPCGVEKRRVTPKHG